MADLATPVNDLLARVQEICMVEQGARTPTFSVVIPCYNNAQFIRETVRSALSQTRQPLQVIVVDDASTDSSVSVLREFGDKITLLPQSENRGGSAARNIGASVADGDYLVFLDGDDALAPWALELYEKISITKSPKLMLASVLFFSGPTVRKSNIYIDNNTPIELFDAYSANIEFVDYGMLCNKDRPFWRGGSVMVIERNTFNRVGGWTAEIFPGEDTELLLKMLYESPAIHILYPPSVYYRTHENNITRQVRRYCQGLFPVIDRARRGFYTPSAGRRSDAYALLAGQIRYWAEKGLMARDYKISIEILIRGLPILLTGAIRRILGTAKSKVSTENLGLLMNGDPTARTILTHASVNSSTIARTRTRAIDTFDFDRDT